KLPLAPTRASPLTEILPECGAQRGAERSACGLPRGGFGRLVVLVYDRAAHELDDAREDQSPDHDRESASEQRVEPHAEPIVPVRADGPPGFAASPDEERARRHLRRDFDCREGRRPPQILVE